MSSSQTVGSASVDSGDDSGDTAGSTVSDVGMAATTDDAERVFSTSILLSAIRCTLTYVIFPFVLPFAGLADLGPVIGVVVSVLAIAANVSSIRRMNASQHRWRVPVSIINVAMIGLVLALLVFDLGALSS